MGDNSQHQAVQANINSIKHNIEKTKAAFLALFDETAVVRDPVMDSTDNSHIRKTN